MVKGLLPAYQAVHYTSHCVHSWLEPYRLATHQKLQNNPTQASFLSPQAIVCKSVRERWTRRQQQLSCLAVSSRYAHFVRCCCLLACSKSGDPCCMTLCDSRRVGPQKLLTGTLFAALIRDLTIVCVLQTSCQQETQRLISEPGRCCLVCGGIFRSYDNCPHHTAVHMACPLQLTS